MMSFATFVQLVTCVRTGADVGVRKKCVKQYVYVCFSGTPTRTCFPTILCSLHCRSITNGFLYSIHSMIVTRIPIVYVVKYSEIYINLKNRTERSFSVSGQFSSRLIVIRSQQIDYRQWCNSNFVSPNKIIGGSPNYVLLFPQILYNNIILLE